MSMMAICFLNIFKYIIYIYVVKFEDGSIVVYIQEIV